MTPFPSQGSSSQGLLIVCHMGPLDHSYPDFHSSTLLNTFYLLLSSIGLSCFLLHSTLLLFPFCTHSFLPLFFSGMGSCYILRIDSSSIISNFPLFISNIPYYISCCSIHRAIWLYTFQVTLYLMSLYHFLSLAILLHFPLLCYILFQILPSVPLHSSNSLYSPIYLLLLYISSIVLSTCPFLMSFFCS